MIEDEGWKPKVWERALNLLGIPLVDRDRSTPGTIGEGQALKEGLELIEAQLSELQRLIAEDLEEREERLQDDTASGLMPVPSAELKLALRYQRETERRLKWYWSEIRRLQRERGASEPLAPIPLLAPEPTPTPEPTPVEAPDPVEAPAPEPASIAEPPVSAPPVVSTSTPEPVSEAAESLAPESPSLQLVRPDDPPAARAVPLSASQPARSATTSNAQSSDAARKAEAKRRQRRKQQKQSRRRSRQ